MMEGLGYRLQWKQSDSDGGGGGGGGGAEDVVHLTVLTPVVEL